jgi:hypothetical protein
MRGAAKAAGAQDDAESGAAHGADSTSLTSV